MTAFELYPEPTHPADHNQPPDLLVQSEIADLYDEAKHWADGEPIADQDTADAITALYDGLHEAGNRADAMRVVEKKPHDEAAAAVQTKWRPFVDAKTGKVAIGKAALGQLLTAWRTKVAAEAAAEAERKRKEAEQLAAEAQAAIRASAGNLEEREKAEVLLVEAKEADKWAGRAEKKATTGTGLRTVWEVAIADQEEALDWAFAENPAAFMDLAQSLAESAVRAGRHQMAGFTVTETKVAH
jgi:hypothetical protein